MRTLISALFLLFTLSACTATRGMPAEAEPLADAAFASADALVQYLEASGVEVGSSFTFFPPNPSVTRAVRLGFNADGSTCTVYAYDTPEAARLFGDDGREASSTRAVPAFRAVPSRTVSTYTVASIQFGSNVTACPAGRSVASRAFQALAAYGEAKGITAGLTAEPDGAAGGS